MNLFDSGSIAPGKNYTHTFTTAGTFSYQSTVGTDNMHGTIKVAPTAVKNGSDIDVTVGTSMPAGVSVDIFVEVPGATSFVSAQNNFSAGTTFTYTPTDGPGVYKFQVRTNKNAAQSGFSPTARATF
jgi:plastocyanin